MWCYPLTPVFIPVPKQIKNVGYLSSKEGIIEGRVIIRTLARIHSPCILAICATKALVYTTQRINTS